MSITCCACEPLLADYPWVMFMQDMRELLFIIAPFATCALLWRLFVINRITPPGNVIVLGLDEKTRPQCLGVSVVPIEETTTEAQRH